MNIFKYAAKNRLRINVGGKLNVEDLYTLSLQQLDIIYAQLKEQESTLGKVSLLGTKTKENKELSIKIEIVKEIVEDKIADMNKRHDQKAAKERELKILSELDSRKDQELKNASTEELQKELENLKNI